MGQPRIADTPPVICSGCGGQYVERPHVDFQAAWDGPVFAEGVATGDGEQAKGPAVSIDELIICSHCIRDGYNVLCTVEPDERTEKIAHLEDAIARQGEELAGAKDYIGTLEDAIAKRQPARARRELRDRPAPPPDPATRAA